ncbi:uncharacterized protein LOC124636630 [Helicoverpa zea]|uniref:uncharacterized protein LOC124636630 n=1 Tax=Helicoverpa zea TaxID=7113 RepID=UPI001F56F076|nr:uncharacterized protein LOC124636630 [Helicoverpa zea]
MKGEIPVCTRCCFCFPLRRGLLAWGYIKLIVDTLHIAFVSDSLLETILYRLDGSNKPTSLLYTEITIALVLLGLFLTDFVATTVFVVGGHMKNVRLIRVFYIFCIAVLVSTILLLALLFSLTVSDISVKTLSHEWINLVLSYSAGFAILVIQCYFVMLLRSEIIKLTKNCQFSFVNHAAEAACTMKCGDEETIEVTQAENDLKLGREVKYEQNAPRNLSEAN